MKYQFDNPPSREGLIHEFGINPDRLHRIEAFIQNAAERNGEDLEDWFKDQYTMEEAAAYLKRLNLIESFAMLCALPGSGRLIVLADAASLGALQIQAHFDKSGQLVRWPASSRFDSDDWPEWESYLKDTTDCLAVSRYPLSEVQWRRKFVSERWPNPHLKPSERLVDTDDLAEWDFFIRGKPIVR